MDLLSHFYHSDVFVSDEMFNRLRQIAARYPAVPGGERPLVVVNPNVAGAAPISGAITGLTVFQTPGDQTLTVGGKAPANVPVTLSVIGTFSSELPDILLSRREIIAEADGTFKLVVPVASGYFRGGIIKRGSLLTTGNHGGEEADRSSTGQQKCRCPGRSNPAKRTIDQNQSTSTITHTNHNSHSHSLTN